MQPFNGVFAGAGGHNTLLYVGSTTFSTLTTTNVQATVTGESISLDGGFNLLGLVQGQATLTLSVQTNVGATTSTGASLTGAELLTMSVSVGPGQSITIGPAGTGVTVTSGTLTVAVLTAGSSQTYVGVSAQNVGGTINLPGLTGTLANLNLTVNRGPQIGDTTTALNWGSLTSDPLPSGFSTQPIVQVSGEMTSVTLLGIFTTSADFSFAIQPANVQLGASNLTGATLITVGLNTLVAGSTTGGAAIGIAAIEPPTPSSGTDSRYWIAVYATGLSAGFALGSSVAAAVGGVTVQVNQAGGQAADGTAASPIDWATAVGLNGDSHYGDSVTAGTIPIDFPGPVDSVSGMLTNLNLFNVITGTASFSLSLASVDVKLSDGETLTGAGLTTVALTNVTASAGSGAFGVNLSGAELGIAVLTAPRPAAGTDDRTWIAVDGINLATASLCFGGVTATVGNLSLAISQSFGQAVNGPNSTRGPPLDWSADLSLDGGQTYGGTKRARSGRRERPYDRLYDEPVRRRRLADGPER